MLLVVHPEEKPKTTDASTVVAALAKQIMSLIEERNKG